MNNNRIDRNKFYYNDNKNGLTDLLQKYCRKNDIVIKPEDEIEKNYFDLTPEIEMQNNFIPIGSIVNRYTNPTKVQWNDLPGIYMGYGTTLNIPRPNFNPNEDELSGAVKQRFSIPVSVIVGSREIILENVENSSKKKWTFRKLEDGIEIEKNNIILLQNCSKVQQVLDQVALEMKFNPIDQDIIIDNISVLVTDTITRGFGDRELLLLEFIIDFQDISSVYQDNDFI